MVKKELSVEGKRTLFLYIFHNSNVHFNKAAVIC